jgi:uncharacterized protein involved in outer membrane biogenesis
MTIKRRLAYFGLAIVLGLAVLAVFGPMLLDTQAVRAEIERRASEALSGKVTLQALSVALVPTPRVEARKIVIEVPQQLNVALERLRVELKFWPLLRGRPEVSSLTVVDPRVSFSGAEGDSSDAPVDAMGQYRAIMEPLGRALREFAPQTTLRITGGDLNLAPLDLRKLDIALDTNPDGFTLDLNAASRLWRRLSLKGRVTYADLAAHVDAELDGLDLPQALKLAGVATGSDQAIESAGGRVSAKAELVIDASWQAKLAIVKSDVAIKLAQLPGPIGLSRGSARAVPGKATLERVGLSLLDSSLLASASYDMQKSALQLAITEGVAGEKLVRWGLERGSVPARFEPKTPLRFAAKRIAWSPKGALEVEASAGIDGGPQIAAVLAWRPELLEVKRLTIDHAGNKASLSATVVEDVTRATFSGVLQGRSIAALLREPPPSESGIVQGNLRVTVDSAQPRRSVASGNLRIDSLDLTWLAGKRAILERVELTADETIVRIADARLDFQEQIFNLRGEVQRTAAGPVINARLESPGVVLDKLLPPPDPNAPPPKPKEEDEESALWPLPVTGRIEMQSVFIQHGKYRVEPFAGNLVLESKRVRLDVKEARMCGVAFPLQVDAVPPQEITATIQLAINGEPLEDTLRCLTGEAIDITGRATLRADLRTQGQVPHLARNMTGTLQADLLGGRINKFALLGNILTLSNLASVGKTHADGFPYRSATVRGRFDQGMLVVEEGGFVSDALNVAATGRIDLLATNSKLTVLVGLLGSLDRVVGSVPIIGGAAKLVAVPVEVTGDIRDPRIVPLDPRAISESMLGVLGRVGRLPGKLVPGETKPAAP